MAPWTGWLELLAEEALLVAALLVVFDGCRRLALTGMAARPALMVAIALVVPVGDAALGINVVRSVRALQADKMAAVALHGREPAGGWEKAASSPAERATLSQQAADVAYMFEGSRTPVLDATGARSSFVPSPEQSREREQFVRDEKGAESSAQAAWERGMRLFVEAALFMLAGLGVGWRQRGRA